MGRARNSRTSHLEDLDDLPWVSPACFGLQAGRDTSHDAISHAEALSRCLDVPSLFGLQVALKNSGVDLAVFCRALGDESRQVGLAIQAPLQFLREDVPGFSFALRLEARGRVGPRAQGPLSSARSRFMPKSSCSRVISQMID